MTAFDVELAGLRTGVQQSLDAFVAEHATGVHEIAPDLDTALAALREMLAGGKRLRPACCYWGYVGAGGIVGSAIVHASASLELLQASALIHDDVMDRSETRRGRPAVHKQFEALHSANKWQGDAVGFGTAAAILIGDLALAWTDTMLYTSGFDDEALHRAKPVFDAMRTELMAGQFLDVLEQSRGGGNVDRARRVMRYKTTAYTIERPLHLGAALAGAAPEVFATYTAYGVPIGEAFQLRDDLLGVFGDPAETGKPAGDDVREGKRTLLIALAQERASAAQRTVLERHIGDANLDAIGLAAVHEVLLDTGAVDAVEASIREQHDRALAALDTDAITPEGADALRAIARAATERSA